jgi:two-component system phosphate regulon response regulator PhoB
MKRTILSIEDSSSFRQLIRMALEFEGYAVFEANGGAAGLEMARSRLPDLILLDVRMPDMDGLAVCQHIMADARLCSIPVVMLSSSDDEEEIEAGLKAGARGYLVKPFYPKELIALANRLLAEKA